MSTVRPICVMTLLRQGVPLRLLVDLAYGADSWRLLIEERPPARPHRLTV